MGDAVNDAIVFDLDDTLYPEREFAFSGFDVVARVFSDRLSATFDLASHMRTLFDSEHRHRVFNVVLNEIGVDTPEPIVREMIETFRTHRPAIGLHDDALRAIERFRGSHKLGVITDGYAVTQHGKVAALKLTSRVDAVIVTDDWGREFWKPHRRAFEEMERLLGTRGNQCTYVADNPDKDFVAPNALGWRTVMIAREGGVYVDAAVADGGEPDQRITSLDQL